MENKSTNKYDKYTIFPRTISVNNKFSLEENQQNYNNNGIISDINSNKNPHLFTNEYILSEFNFDKHDNINIMSESFSIKCN